MIQNYQLTGPIVPAVRMTQRSKWSEQAQRYLANRSDIQWQIKQRMNECNYEKFPDKTALFIKVDYWPPVGKRQMGDVDNILKSIKDAMAGILFRNDLWFDHDQITRHDCSGEGMASVEIGIFEDWWTKRRGEK